MICKTNCETVLCACGFPSFLSLTFASGPAFRSSAGPRLPLDLDGHFGWNRASGPARHYAQNDLDALRAWLTQFAASPATLTCYRREAERLLFWAVLDRGKPLSSLSHDDLLCYPSFLGDPQPREKWVAAHGMRTGRDRNAWRPFAGPLSARSIGQSLAVINRMFAWLVDTGYLRHNPLLPSKNTPRATLLLPVELNPADCLQLFSKALDSLPRGTRREQEHAERTRWLFALLYYGGLRLSEVSGHAMGAFHVRLSSGSSESDESYEWWIALDDPNGARRRRPVGRELMSALIRYRLAQGLPALPARHERSPLVLPIGGREQALRSRALHGIVEKLFVAASRLASGEGTERISLKGGSPNWLRHFSERTNAVDVAAISQNEADTLVLAATSESQAGTTIRGEGWKRGSRRAVRRTLLSVDQKFNWNH